MRWSELNLFLYVQNNHNPGASFVVSLFSVRRYTRAVMSRPSILFLLFCSVLIAACDSGTRQTAIPTVTSVGSSATPSAGTHPDSPIFFEPSSEIPVFTHGTTGDWYAGAVEPGVVLFFEGQFHMFFNGFDGWPSKSAVGYAVSDDGVTWDMPSEDPMLDSASADFGGFTFFVSSVAQLPDGRWAMYLYSLTEGRDGAPGSILIALSSSLAGPWQLHPEPVLDPGDKGDWDGSRVTQPHVLRVGEGYRMYFAGYEDDRLQGGRWIGMATSPDGLSWEKMPEPVFQFSENPRDWDAFRVFQPRVVQVSDGFVMLYKSNVSVGRNEAWGFARSPDGLTWTRLDGNPVIDEKTYPIEWRRNGIAELLVADGQLVLYLEILEREGGAYHHGNAGYFSNIFRFTSTVIP